MKHEIEEIGLVITYTYYEGSKEDEPSVEIHKLTMGGTDVTAIMCYFECLEEAITEILFDET